MSLSTRIAQLVKGARGAPVAFVVRVGGRVLALASTIVLARVIGVEQYGIYTYVTAWMTVLVVPAILGYDQLILRHVAIYKGRGASDLMHGLLRRAHQVVVPLSLLTAAVGALIAAIVIDPIYLTGMLIALPTIPLRVLGRLREGVLQGLRHPELSFLPQFVVLPGVTMAGVLILSLAGVNVVANMALAIYVVATALGLLLSAWLARHYLRPLIADTVPRFADAVWRRSLVPFTAMAVILMLSAQVGVIMLGSLGTPSDAGVFQVALRLAEPVTLLLAVVNISTAPRFAHLHDIGDLEGMRRVARRASRITFGVALPVSAVLVGAQSWLLGIFGAGFHTGGAALSIVVLGQLVTAFTGTVNTSLMMAGQGRYVVMANGSALVLDVILCAILIPMIGVTGAAIGRAVDVTAWNCILAVVAWKRLGINCSPLPWPPIRRERISPTD